MVSTKLLQRNTNRAWASLVGQEASPNAHSHNKGTPTQNAGVRPLLGGCLKIGDFLDLLAIANAIIQIFQAKILKLCYILSKMAQKCHRLT